MSGLYDEDYYVILRSDREDEFVTRVELEQLLTETIAQVEHLAGTPLTERVRALIDMTCEYVARPGEYLQWYVTRLEK